VQKKRNNIWSPPCKKSETSAGLPLFKGDGRGIYKGDGRGIDKGDGRGIDKGRGGSQSKRGIYKKRGGSARQLMDQ